MNIKLFLVSAVVLLFLFDTAYSQGVVFEQGLSWKEVQEKAKRENKNIFIDVYATWCVPCSQMDAKVYPSQVVGNALKEKFISIRLQQDKTSSDNAHIQSWYQDADAIVKKYQVDAFPTYLFLSPQGRMLYRGIGFQDPETFVRMVALALTDPIQRYRNELLQYSVGNIKYRGLPALIRQIKGIDKNDSLAFAIAKDYKKNYLDRLPKERLLDREILNFIGDYHMLINSNDNFFKLCYSQPEKVDEIKGYQGWSSFQVIQTIVREELDTGLCKDRCKGAAIKRSPDWKRLKSVVSKKYPKVDAIQLVLNQRIGYYSRIANWKEFVCSIDEKNKCFPPKPGTGLTSDSWFLNVSAWKVFEQSDNKQLLTRALEWANIAIRLDEEGCKRNGEAPNIQIWDTKANLLYKLGRHKEGIAWEEKARHQGIENARKRGVDKGDFYEDFTAVIKKMKRGEPTWPNK